MVAKFGPDAPCSQAPLLRVFQTRDHLSVISGLTLNRRLATITLTRAMTGLESINFLQHLHSYCGCKLLVIWDGAPIHRSKEVKEFLADGWAKKLDLGKFPAYAPELSLNEAVWQHLKHVELRNLYCFDFGHLCIELTLAIKRMRRNPKLIQSSFAGARPACRASELINALFCNSIAAISVGDCCSLIIKRTAAC